MQLEMNSYFLHPTTTPTNSINNSLKIFVWNAAGLSNKLAEMKMFLHRNNVDIMLVSETHLLDTDNINISGYDIYMANHPSNRRRGGAATFIKRSIRHMALSSVPNPKIQYSPIVVALHNNSSINIAAAYFPPGNIWTSDDFRNLFRSMGKKFIIAGDWNAKSSWWGNARACSRGTALLQCIQQNRYNILATGSPTHFPFNSRHSPSAIDFGVYGGIRHNLITINASYDLGSDHLPLQIDLLDSPPILHTKPQLLPNYASIRKFQTWLNNHVLIDTEIQSAADIDDCVEIFERNVNLAALHATAHLQTRSQVGQLRCSSNSHNILKMIEVKRIIKKQLTQSRNPIIKVILNHLTNRLRKALKDEKENRINRLLESIDPDSRYNMQKLWRITNNIKRQPAPNLPVRKHLMLNNGVTSNSQAWCKTTEEKAEAFGQHLECRFSPIFTNLTADRCLIEQQVQSISPSDTPSFRLITDCEVLSEIKQLKTKKSPGIDNVDNRTIKALPLIAVQYIVMIFNNILKHGHYPSKWKLALVKMIPKPGKPSDQLSSYRPISLLSGLSKFLSLFC